MRSKLRQRLTLVLIVAAFVVPMVAAYITFSIYQKGHFRTTNRGQLIEPAVDVKHLTVETDDQQVKTIAQLNDIGELRGRWILTYVAPRKCDDGCLKTSYYLNQLYLALGKNRPYLLSMVLQPQPSEVPTPLQTNVTYVTATEDELNGILEQVPIAQRPTAAGAIYLIDAHGFLIMAYATDENPDNILKDLQHLVRS